MNNQNTKIISKIEIAVKKPFLLNLFISFMLGRVFLADCISPFALGYICSYMGTKGKSSAKVVLTVIFAVLGILTTTSRTAVLKYMLAYVLFGIMYISVSALSRGQSSVKICSSAAAANLISGVIYYAQLDNMPYNLAMLAVESAACFVIPFVIKSTAEIICGEKELTEIKTEDIAGIYFLMAAVVTGFCEIYIGNISVGKSLCALCIMIIAFTGGCSAATTCGVGIGILNSLYAFELNEYAGIFGFCGICAGALSRFKRPGVILGFVVSSRLLALYFGGWSDCIFTDFETIISVCLFCLIPYSALMNIKTFFSVNSYRSEELGRMMSSISERLKGISKTFSALAELSAKISVNTPPNTADPGTAYDMAADKVCKSCGLKFICWDKESFDTRDLLNKLITPLEKKGFISSEDIPERFRQKCIKSTIFVNELNRTFCRLKAESNGTDRLNRSQKLISMQLEGMSDIVDDITSDINQKIIFDKSKENAIYSRLEQEGIRCSDVTAVKDADGISTVNMRVRQGNSDFTKISGIVERSVTEILGKNMGIEHYSHKKGKYFIKLSEREQYSAECSIKSLPKNGEKKCGDNVTCGRISGGKYAVILSDGMGSGEKASEISKTAIELMQQFLNAGFDKDSSVNMVGSALMMSDSETFTTIDAVITDLHTAKTEFIKAGANITYIKSKNSIKKISSTSLPVGIIENTAIDTAGYRAQNGDIIVMISDGIHSAADDWFEEYLLNMHEENPDVISSLLLDEAVRSKKQDDDMTVAVIKITKR